MSIEVVIILTLAGLATVMTFFGYFVFRHLKLRQNVFVEAVAYPFYFFIWWLFFVFVLNQISALENYTIYLLELGVIFFLVLSIYRFIGGVESRFINGKYLFAHVDLTSVRAVSRLMRVILTIFALLLLLPVFHIPVSGVLAFGGAAGVGISFAAKDLLSNFFGGFTVMLDRPFSLGDKIRALDQNFEGYVEHIGWRSTRLRTEEKRPLFVPNSNFLTISIENVSKITSKKIERNFYVDSRKMENIRQAVNALLNQLKNHPLIDQKELVSVHLNYLTQQGPQVQIICFTKKMEQSDYQEVIQEVLLLAIEIFEKNQVAILFNTLGLTSR
ncbi:mechanosensitive ion channel family protein [bacterium]|nr:mechanosensitive ion channel family protein [bacterium]